MHAINRYYGHLVQINYNYSKVAIYFSTYLNFLLHFLTTKMSKDISSRVKRNVGLQYCLQTTTHFWLTL